MLAPSLSGKTIFPAPKNIVNNENPTIKTIFKYKLMVSLFSLIISY
jgi:hypothetical protein